MHSPLEQFRIYSLIKLPRFFGINIDFTNSALFMCLAVISVMILLLVSAYRCEFVPNKKQALAELLYGFVDNMLTTNVSGYSAIDYFPFIFTLFFYVLSCNVLGLMPYGFTVTSHITITFALGLMVAVFVTVVGFCRHGIKFFNIFLPPGTPWWLMPLMAAIEVLTYFARSVTLAIRLGANMIAGHTMLKVVALFVAQISVFFAVVPFAFLILLNLLELFVAALQAYIFAILTCVYLNSVINLH